MLTCVFRQTHRTDAAGTTDTFSHAVAVAKYAGVPLSHLPMTHLTLTDRAPHTTLHDVKHTLTRGEHRWLHRPQQHTTPEEIAQIDGWGVGIGAAYPPAVSPLADTTVFKHRQLLHNAD